MDDMFDRAEQEGPKLTRFEKASQGWPVKLTGFEEILESHYPECPMAVSARKQVKSTLCYCAQIEKANADAKAENDPCLRCHQFPEFCKCGKRAQYI